ncbi:hypothetical protein KEJ18_05645 [Candidatus Bathyarchaeota archaeon]|nr:hypothetical protein [Candidatus Bathyarchaeota archaeon]
MNNVKLKKRMLSKEKNRYISGLLMPTPSCAQSAVKKNPFNIINGATGGYVKNKNNGMGRM